MAQAAALKKPPAKSGKIGKEKKWGYIFIAPFIIVFLIFQAWPLIETFYYSVFEYYRSGLDWIGPNFVGFDNFAAVFNFDRVNIFGLTYNTLVMWAIGFIPQIVVSLLFAYWFTNVRLRLKCLGVFKTIIYMPNLIMASAFAMLIFSLFSDIGPINEVIKSITGEAFRFLDYTWSTMGLVGLMNFMMWFGNTTILLMAAMMGINESVIEAAEIDGANSAQIFWKITLPLIRPILVYVLITSLIGGLQMYDVPQILTAGAGSPNFTTRTLIMYLSANISGSPNYGAAGAISVIVFIICAALSLVVYYGFAADKSSREANKRAKAALKAEKQRRG
ncbi:MAG: sugar ABC transporter permease [Eubacterium sp.]|nr:sugar ABC transporter permease [Eubacterium sp.]